MPNIGFVLLKLSNINQSIIATTIILGRQIISSGFGLTYRAKCERVGTTNGYHRA